MSDRDSRPAAEAESTPVEEEEAVTITIGWKAGVVALVAVVAVGAAVMLVPRLTQTSAGGQTDDPTAAQARVNERDVTGRDVDVMYEIQKALQMAAGRGLNEDPETVRAVKRDMLDQLVDSALILEAAAGAGITATEEELDTELTTLVQQQGVNLDAVRQAAAAAGVTDAEFRAWALEQLIAMRYLLTADAQAKGKETQLRRGMPAEALAGYVAQPADVATALQTDADIRFFITGVPEGVAAVREGMPAPDFTVLDANSQPVTLSSLKGQPVMLNFWATWCTPCKIEMPLYADVYGQNKDQGLEILAVNVQEQLPAVQQYIAANGLPFPVILDTDGGVATIYRVRGLPTTVFVDASGIVRKVHRGAITKLEELVPLLQEILPQVQILRDAGSVTDTTG